MVKNNEYKYAIYSLIIAVLLWYALFVIKPMNFWFEMALSITILIIIGFVVKKDLLKFESVTLRHIMIGIISAAILYLIFYLGNIISGFIFPFKNAQISSVYGNKAQGSLKTIGLLLFFLIGPGEEIYWRGFIQKVFSDRFGGNKGYIIGAILYTAVHITTLNFMLILASAVCGFFWGWLYKKEKSLVPVIISHALWDLTIFVLLPIM